MFAFFIKKKEKKNPCKILKKKNQKETIFFFKEKRQKETMSNIQQHVEWNAGTITTICDGHIWELQNGVATFDGIRIPEMDNIAIESQETLDDKIYVNGICLNEKFGHLLDENPCPMTQMDAPFQKNNNCKPTPGRSNPSNVSMDIVITDRDIIVYGIGFVCGYLLAFLTFSKKK